MFENEHKLKIEFMNFRKLSTGKISGQHFIASEAKQDECYY